MAMVKCLYCGMQFDREKIECVKLGRRYAHVECAANQGKRHMIHEKMNQVCAGEYSRAKVNSQINNFIAQGISEDDILLTLNYWFDVRKEDPAKANGGIGIVGFVIDDAKRYYNNLNKASRVNANINIKDYLDNLKER